MVCYCCKHHGHHAKDCRSSEASRSKVREICASEQVSEISESPKHCLGVDPSVPNIFIDGKNVKIALDTAADVTVVTESLFYTLGIEPKPNSRHLVRTGGNPITVTGEAVACIKGKRKYLEARVSIVKGEKLNMFGVQQIRGLCLLPVVGELGNCSGENS